MKPTTKTCTKCGKTHDSLFFHTNKNVCKFCEYKKATLYNPIISHVKIGQRLYPTDNSWSVTLTGENKGKNPYLAGTFPYIEKNTLIRGKSKKLVTIISLPYTYENHVFVTVFYEKQAHRVLNLFQKYKESSEKPTISEYIEKYGSQIKTLKK